MLERIVRRKKSLVFLGYNLRFLPALQCVKAQLLRQTIGALYFAQIEMGQYLPTWRTNIAYSESYSSKREYGGGVALDLSHEVDYMRYLFGEPCLWKTLKTKVSDLKIDSDDVFAGIYKYKSGFICHIHLDYLQPEPKRQIRIVGSKGYIICDLIGKWIEVRSGRKKFRITKESFFRIEDTYIAELKLFLKNLKKHREVAISINDGINDLKLLEDGHD
jgi:predicted dehydrogenase